MSSLRVAIAHNFYDRSQPSGENAAVLDEVNFLCSAGVEVYEMFRYSDSITGWRERGRATMAALAAPASVRELRRELLDAAPHIVHLHNPLPLLGPALVNAARSLAIPVVQTVHNRRIACLAGTQFRDGASCALCAGTRFPEPALRYRCYRNSRVQTAVMAVSRSVRADAWTGLEHYFPVSLALRDVLLKEGIPNERITVKTNPVLDHWSTSQLRRLNRKPTILYAGRLSVDKGVLLLLDAFRSLSPPRPNLVIAGAGPLRETVASFAEIEKDVSFLGAIEKDAIVDLFVTAWAVVVPSLGSEGLPRTLAEAYAAGRPVIVVEGQPQSELARAGGGWVCAPTASALAAAMAEVGDLTPEAHRRLSHRAHAVYSERFSPENVMRGQLSVYARIASEGVA